MGAGCPPHGAGLRNGAFRYIQRSCEKPQSSASVSAPRETSRAGMRPLSSVAACPGLSCGRGTWTAERGFSLQHLRSPSFIIQFLDYDRANEGSHS